MKDLMLQNQMENLVADLFTLSRNPTKANINTNGFNKFESKPKKYQIYYKYLKKLIKKKYM